MQNKTCSHCNVEKPVGCFYRNKRTPDGFSYRCKQCDSQSEKRYYYSELGQNTKKKNAIKRQQRDPHYQKRCTMQYLYGLTLEQHQKMYHDQKGKCAICGVAVAYDKIKTDHDHNTKMVRGLLCNTCNVALGHYETWFKAWEAEVNHYLY
jgi:hypothetical protein